MPASSGQAAWRAGLLGVSVAALRASCCLLCPGSGLCVPASSGRAAWCARLLDVSVAVLQACCCFACGGLLVSSVVPLCTDQSCPPVTNVARNSPPHISDFEIRPLELQRLWAISKNDRVELRAKLIWRSPRFPPRVAWPEPTGARHTGGDGGFAPLGASLRRVAGVSRL